MPTGGGKGAQSVNFTSLGFVAFFPAVLVLHWLLPSRRRWVLLLAASYLFYMDANPPLALLLLATTAVSYVCALRIDCAQTARGRRRWLLPGAGAPLMCLIFFKYTGLLLASGASLLRLSGLGVDTTDVNILLPVGISFYTFQTLSYVLDVYRGRIRPERHFGYYALFVSFFPQLVAGPIERPEHLLPQLKAERKPCGDDIRQGVWLMLRGFFKKLAVADVLAAIADPVFAAAGQATGPAVLTGTVCFALQIYCDFSGYSDIACGSARLMGIRLMRNFDRPYRAQSIRDFWRRWHISLTGWFSDYVYKPLGGNRAGLAKQLRNILVVFLLSGLWHGASWNFLVWGGIHGLYQIAGTLWRRAFPQKRSNSAVPAGLRRLRTFALTCFAWIFFRAASLGDAWLLVGRLLIGWDALGLRTAYATAGLTVPMCLQVLLALGCLRLLERMPEELRPARLPHETARRCLAVSLLLLTIAFSWLSVFSGTGENAFMYFQF